MNVELKNIDSVNAIVKIDIVKNDYAGQVEKSLKDLRQKATIPGFRKGMVPMGLVKKMYGKSAEVEEVNKLVSSQLYDYIQKNNLNILGEPLPNETEQPEIDFNAQEDFTFCFDLGLAPEMKVKLTKKDKLPYYVITVSDEAIDQQITSFRSNYGTYSQVDSLEGKDMAKGLLVELNEDGSAKEDGIRVEDAVLMPFYMKNETEKAKFDQVKKDTTVVFSPYTAYEGQQAELASLLKIEKEDTEKHVGNFSFEIKEITRYSEAELNTELFDKVFEPGTIKTEEEFRAKIKEMIGSQYAPDSDYKFLLDGKKLLEKKAGDVQFPDAFLKRWLVASNKDRSPESLEEDYPKIIEDLRFHLIKEEIARENKFDIEENELMEYAKKSVRAQFAQYGMANVPADLLEDYAKNMLKQEKTVRGLIDKAMEDKLIGWMKEHITLDTQNVTVEEFRKFFEEPENAEKD